MGNCFSQFTMKKAEKNQKAIHFKKRKPIIKHCHERNPHPPKKQKQQLQFENCTTIVALEQNEKRRKQILYFINVLEKKKNPKNQTKKVFLQNNIKKILSEQELQKPNGFLFFWFSRYVDDHSQTKQLLDASMRQSQKKILEYLENLHVFTKLSNDQATMMGNLEETYEDTEQIFLFTRKIPPELFKSYVFDTKNLTPLEKIELLFYATSDQTKEFKEENIKELFTYVSWNTEQIDTKKIELYTYLYVNLMLQKGRISEKAEDTIVAPLERVIRKTTGAILGDLKNPENATFRKTLTKILLHAKHFKQENALRYHLLEEKKDTQTISLLNEVLSEIKDLYGIQIFYILRNEILLCKQAYETAPQKDMQLLNGYHLLIKLLSKYHTRIQCSQPYYAKKTPNYQLGYGINLNPSYLYSGMSQDILHEIGHGIDYKFIRIEDYEKEDSYPMCESQKFKNGLLLQTARKELEQYLFVRWIEETPFEIAQTDTNHMNHIKMLELEYRKKHDKIITSMIQRMKKDNETFDVWDIIENITDGEISAYVEGHASHGKNYWKKIERKYTEIFAELFSATLSNPESSRMILEIFPKTYQIFLDIVDKLLINY